LYYFYYYYNACFTDSNKDDNATDKFQQVNRAYEVLSNPVLKSKFDMFGADGIGTSAASDEIKANSRQSYDWFPGNSGRRGSDGVSMSPDGYDSFHTNPFQNTAAASSSPSSSSGRDKPVDKPFVNTASSYSGDYYDAGFGNFGTSSGSYGRHQSANPADIFGGGGRGNGRDRGMVGEDLQMDMDVDFETAIFGGREKIWIDHLETCTYCRGTGDAAVSNERNCCQTCGGSGFIVDLAKASFGSRQTQRTCHSCRGSGKTVEEDCDSCYGQGMVERAKQVEVTIPAGVEGYTRLRVRGEGNAGPKGGPAGDLFIFLHIEPHPTFLRDGAHIHANHTVDYIDSILGATVETPVVGGKYVRLDIPERTQHQDQLRVSGHGAKSLVGEPGARGDHFAYVQLEIPEELTDEELDILYELKELHDKREARKASARLLEIQEEAQAVVDNDLDSTDDDDDDDSDLKEIAGSFSAHFASVVTEKEKPPSKPKSSSSSTTDPGTIRIDTFEKKYVTEDSIDTEATAKKIETTPTETGSVNIAPTTKTAAATAASPEPEVDTETPFFARDMLNPANELDKLRELLNAPIESTKKTTEAKRKAREMEERTNNELDKLRQLLYAPIESTKKTTDAKAKARQVELMTNNELDKLRELLNAPVESTKKTAEAKRKAQEAEEVTKKELELLRQLLQEPLLKEGRDKKSAKNDAVSSSQGEALTQKELEQLAELLEPTTVEAEKDSAKSKQEASDMAKQKAEATLKLENDLEEIKAQKLKSDLEEIQIQMQKLESDQKEIEAQQIDPYQKEIEAQQIESHQEKVEIQRLESDLEELEPDLNEIATENVEFNLKESTKGNVESDVKATETQLLESDPKENEKSESVPHYVKLSNPKPESKAAVKETQGVAEGISMKTDMKHAAKEFTESNKDTTIPTASITEETQGVAQGVHFAKTQDTATPARATEPQGMAHGISMETAMRHVARDQVVPSFKTTSAFDDDTVIPTVISQRPLQTTKRNPWVFSTTKAPDSKVEIAPTSSLPQASGEVTITSIIKPVSLTRDRTTKIASSDVLEKAQETKSNEEALLAADSAGSAKSSDESTRTVKESTAEKEKEVEKPSLTERGVLASNQDEADESDTIVHELEPVDSGVLGTSTASIDEASGIPEMEDVDDDCAFEDKLFSIFRR
jgi:molecular chaperone DnaJ